MREQAETPERALPFEPADDVVRQTDALEGRAEHELAGMEHERLAVLRADLLGEVVEVSGEVDVGLRGVLEDEERVVQAKVDARRLEARFVERIDDDAPGADLLEDRAVGEDHQAGVY